ncbi:hypothetical protein Pan189_26280 [Stratiformator vulcanicus]|uniref:Planctomycete cytochrome C n=2 Tax=Stratiformator vulcanicus TaxID=2527980 RepID=A0A517R2Y4_9PLAN|nr:hypothetical protein Pan189_26280 [Stratiformator vulcanicus]
MVAVAAPELDSLDRFLDSHCLACHDDFSAEAGLDLSNLDPDFLNGDAFSVWVKVHDRVEAGEMPPESSDRPEEREKAAFLKTLSRSLTAAEEARKLAEGRSTWRRLNRYEYENTLRELLELPWLPLKDKLPEDGEAHHFNKVGDALDVSHVQMSRYLSTAEYALKQAVATQVKKPAATTTRFYTREDRQFYRRIEDHIRATFPLVDYQLDQKHFRAWHSYRRKQHRTKEFLLPESHRKIKPPPIPTVGESDQKRRNREAMAVVQSTYEPMHVYFENFKAPMTARYKVRLAGYSIWVGPQAERDTYHKDVGEISPGRRSEPITVYSFIKPNDTRRLGAVDFQPESTVGELTPYLFEGESIRPDAARLVRCRPGDWANPLETDEGLPGAAYQWLEVEGPLFDQWPPAGHRLLFGDLPIEEDESGAVRVLSKAPLDDAERLLGRFIEQAYRKPADERSVARFLSIVQHSLATGSDFTDAMIAGYTAVLCSPEFLFFEERPGQLSDTAVADRLAYFLWNSPPDDELLSIAATKQLSDPEILRAQVERMLDDPRSERFVEAFLDYWLDLRKMGDNSADSKLYPEYQLDDLLTESMVRETRLYFKELIDGNLGVTNVVDSDFVIVNERLARHYGLKNVRGSDFRTVSLPEDSVRGGLMTQGSVLKVTANGTTTSPVLRGVWVNERILGLEVPPPPTEVPAVEPDTRGTTTIREQLAAHTDIDSCAVCHRKIDPAGFALESFDVMGAYRDRYRSLGKGQEVQGVGHHGQYFEYKLAHAVDASGRLPTGELFEDIRELKQLLTSNPEQLAHAFVDKLAVYATGAPVGFSDRAEVEHIVDRSAKSDYGIRTLIHKLVASKMFRRK